MRQLPAIVSIFLSFFCFVQCTKELSVSEDESGLLKQNLNVDFRNQSHDSINFYLEGKWKLHYSHSGWGLREDHEKDNSYFIYEKGRFVSIRKGVILIDEPYRLIAIQPNPSDYFHNIIEWGVPGSGGNLHEPVRIFNDTLVIAEPFLNTPHYSLSYLTRK